MKASAVCQYSLADIQKAFDGPFMENQDSKWREFTGKVPQPRPGSVRYEDIMCTHLSTFDCVCVCVCVLK